MNFNNILLCAVGFSNNNLGKPQKKILMAVPEVKGLPLRRNRTFLGTFFVFVEKFPTDIKLEGAVSLMTPAK